MIAGLGYVVIAAQDVAAWDKFGTQILGLQKADISGDALYLKMDDAPFRYMIEQAAGEPGPDVLAATGWDAGDDDNLNALIEKIEAAGATVTEGAADEAAARCVTRFVKSADPAGNGLELYVGRTDTGDAFVSPIGVSGFVTEPMGMGHAVIPAPNDQECADFYQDVLGFGISDDLRLPPPAEGAPDMRIVFFHADNPRHHSLALGNFPTPTKCIHLMMEVNTLDEVGAALDRVTQAGLPLMASLGRHENDKMVSFYVVGPGGIAIEYGYDGLQVDDWAGFAPTVSTSGDIWGHEYATPEM